MVLTKIPIAPQWHLSNGCVCTPDGGFLYVGCRSINYVGPLQQSCDNINANPPVIKVFHTRQNIASIDVDPGWPLQDNVEENVNPENKAGSSNMPIGFGNRKYFAALAQDNSVQIWDFDRGCAVSGHKAHYSSALYMDGNGPSPQGDHVLLSYMRNRNVLSINSHDILVYCVASNTYCRRQMFISTRNQALTVLRCSPYNEHIFAVGTNRGLVVIGDLQSMSTLYMLRGHESPITSLSWCPQEADPLNRPIDVAKETGEQNRTAPQIMSKGQKQSGLEPQTNSKAQSNSKKSAIPPSNDDIFDIYDYDYLENEFGAPTTAESEVNKSVEECVIDKSLERGPTTNFDFAEACQSLKEEIVALKNEEESERDGCNEMTDVTLADCQNAAGTIDYSSSCGDSRESSEGSLVIADRCSSDDEICVDGSEIKLKQQILHQAEVHAEQFNELENKDIEHTDMPVNTVKVGTDGTIENDEKQTVNSESSSEQPSVDGVATQNNSPISKNGTDNPIFLVSASLDAYFWIWNTNTGASCDRVRPKDVGKNHCDRLRPKDKKLPKNLNLHVDWLSSTQFISTNKNGDLSLWSMIEDNLSDPTKPQHQRYKFKEDVQKKFQQRSVMSFSISQKHKLLWCLSSLREICCENLFSEKLILKYCCSSTNVSAMRECPDDMNKIALGFSDRRVGIIDISKMSATNVSIQNYVHRVEASVLSLVWSPDSKRLAFGTLEGRVGVVNVDSGKPIDVFNPFCGKPIYSIDWQYNHLFVVCNDMLAIYDTNADLKDAHIVREAQNVSSVSVRGGVLYVGTQNGHVQVYHRSPNSPYSYIKKQDVPLATRYITEIAWSPIASDHVAVVANSNTIHILKASNGDGLLTLVQTITMKPRKAANAWVKWSNHNANEFLTCGFDGCVRVWDLKSTNTNEEKFLKQFPCPMTCGLFLPTDEQIVMCAGKSTSLEMFDMRLEQTTMYKAGKYTHFNSHPLDEVKWASKIPARIEAKPLTAAEKRRAKRAIVGGTEIQAANGDAGSAENGAEVVEKLGALKLSDNDTVGVKKEEENQVPTEQQVAKANDAKTLTAISVFLKNPTTLLNLTTKELNKDVLEKLNMVLNNTGSKTLLCPKLFGTKSDAQQLLAEELKNHRSSKNIGISSLFMTQLNFTIREEIQNCIQNKQLCEWHVAVAPTISFSFWQKCCQAFADQLLEQGFALQAATYIIAMHRHVEAIEMLMSKHYYKEALLIGRIHLQSDDPLLATISDRWITHLDMNGNLTGSALLCVLFGQINRAHDTLAKVRNVHPEIERVLEKIKSRQDFKQ
uniref:Protein rigor mortis n=1 Tax=Ceratitis capitata TaxID=7213 RepID=W8BGC4_CERCA